LFKPDFLNTISSKNFYVRVLIRYGGIVTMQINKIQPNYTFTAQTDNAGTSKSFLDNFHSKVRNSADMNDTIVVPRTIFKGYLGIMTGTTLLTLGSLLSKHAKLSKFLGITGALTSFYGTWAFVRPYILKDNQKV